MSTHHTSSDALVIGSGAAGLSVAMQLAWRGLRVRVLERRGLISGATSRAAGLLGQMRGSVASTRMMGESIAILREVEKRAGKQVFFPTGSVRVAQTPARVEELQRHLAIARASGLDVREIPAAAARDLIPFMHTDDLLLCALCAGDGYLEPPELARLYLELGRAGGVAYHEECPAEAILHGGGKASGVRAGGCDYHAPIVINAAGPWCSMVADLAGEALPTTPIAHFYLTTHGGPDGPIAPEAPTFRDRELLIYARYRNGGWRVGIYETSPKAHDMRELPGRFTMADFHADAAHPTVAKLLDAAHARFPFITRHTPMELSGGIMSFTPDGQPLIGKLPQLDGLYHCAGFCGHGIMQSPIFGRIAAELILDGTCRHDLAAITADRFEDWPGLRDAQQITAACRGVYRDYYAKVDAG